MPSFGRTGEVDTCCKMRKTKSRLLFLSRSKYLEPVICPKGKENKEEEKNGREGGRMSVFKFFVYDFEDPRLTCSIHMLLFRSSTGRKSPFHSPAT